MDRYLSDLAMGGEAEMLGEPEPAEVEEDPEEEEAEEEAAAAAAAGTKKKPAAAGAAAAGSTKKPAAALGRFAGCLKRPAAAAGGIRKKPAAAGAAAAAEAAEEAAAPEDGLTELRDRMKSRKFEKVFAALPPYIKKEFEEAKADKTGQGRKRQTKLINEAIERKGNGESQLANFDNLAYFREMLTRRKTKYQKKFKHGAHTSWI